MCVFSRFLSCVRLLIFVRVRVYTYSISLPSIIVPIVGQPAQVTLNTLAAGPVPANAIRARVIGPFGHVQDAIVTPAPQGYNLRFNVPEPGSYVIETEVCTIPLRPAQITAIEPLDPSKVRAYGPGLSQGTVNKPADFIVDTRGAGNGQLGVTVEGPSESKIDYQDNNDGSCRVTYHPTGSFSFPLRFLCHSRCFFYLFTTSPIV
jgi:filamin